MSMKPVRSLVFVATLVLLPAWAAHAQRAAVQAQEEEPMPPSLPRLAGAPPRAAPPDAAVSSVGVPRPPAVGAAADDFLPSLMGAIGLYHLSTAEVGPENHLRLALHGEFFKSSEFLVQGDKNTRVNGSFSFGYTPHQYVEIFGAFLTSSNRNVRTDPANMPARRDPELIKSFGDLVLGPKVAVPVARGLTVGFELGFRFLSSISDLSVSPSSTSLWLGPLFMLDLRPINDTPLRFHASANYYVDNSKNLINFSDMTISPFTREVATFAYGIQESRFRVGLGADWNLEKIAPAVPMRLFGEYHAEIVTGSAQAAFAGQMNDSHSRAQQWFTLGLRARVFHGITLDAGTDIRASSVGYQYGPPLPPYNVIFGVAYPLDIDAFTRPVVVTRTIERNVNMGPGPAVEGQVVGTVKNAKDGRPVAAALVAVAKRPLARVATDPDGSFQTVPLPPGPAELDISAPGFESTKVTTAVILGHPARADVALTPKLLTGNVRGKVTDGKGHALQAALRLAGAEVFSAQADPSGQFSAALPVGTYRVTAEMPQMPPKEVPLEILDGQDRQLDIVMSTPNPNVTLTGDAITLKQPIKFKAGAPRLDPKIEAELDGVAELLASHPEVRTVRIEAYWDSSAGAKATSLTDSQAKAVKAYLVKKGVEDGRVEAVGKGADQPLVPNIGPVNKAKNRRVELHVVQ
jgi:outer membrane protein OmpA-like peptidoglycan-associated protein